MNRGSCASAYIPPFYLHEIVEADTTHFFEVSGILVEVESFAWELERGYSGVVGLKCAVNFVELVEALLKHMS